MKTVFFITVLSGMFLFSGHVYAAEGMEHQEGMAAMEQEKGVMAEPAGSAVGGDIHLATEEETQTLPNVGNKVCPVSGEAIGGDMGEGVKLVYNGKIYNLCCPMCQKSFRQEPEKFSKIAEDEVATEKAGK